MMLERHSRRLNVDEEHSKDDTWSFSPRINRLIFTQAVDSTLNNLFIFIDRSH